LSYEPQVASCKKMKTIHYIIIAIILIIVIGALGLKLGLVVGKKSLESEIAQYKKIIDYYFPMFEETYNVSGKITEIQDNALGVETIIQDPYVLPDEWKTKIVKVIIGDETKITKFDMETGASIELNFSTLKVGDEISANADENIKDKNEFTAKYVELMVAPEMPEILEPELE